MKILNIIKKILLSLCIFIFILLILQFIVNPKYSFPEPHAFKGEYIYNPYRNFDSTKWRRANFHAHLRKLFVDSNRTSGSLILLDSLYKSFGYNIISISDYQSVNLYESTNEWFIPVYEHGFQYFKNHQLVLNAKKVSWQDFPFRQTLSNKQFIIDQLKKDTTTLITIVHPIFRNAYTNNDLKYLGNYNFLEIANSNCLFTSCYDTILSEGHPVFIMADDDSHELNNIKDICGSFNMLNSDLVKDSILKSLLTGRSIGVKFNISSFKTNEEKRAALLRLPDINLITFKNDTLNVSLNLAVQTIKFIGQHGIEIKRITSLSKGYCLFRKQDTYIRTEIECYDGTVYFLNPLFRYDGIRLTDYVPVLNVFRTWVWRSAVLCIFLLSFIIWYRKRCITKKK